MNYSIAMSNVFFQGFSERYHEIDRYYFNEKFENDLLDRLDVKMKEKVFTYSKLSYVLDMQYFFDDADFMNDNYLEGDKFTANNYCDRLLDLIDDANRVFQDKMLFCSPSYSLPLWFDRFFDQLTNEERYFVQNFDVMQANTFVNILEKFLESEAREPIIIPIR